MDTLTDLPAYRTHPVHRFDWLDIQKGHEALAARIHEYVTTARVKTVAPLVALEGFIGVRWELFVNRLRDALADRGITGNWLATDTCFLHADRIDELLRPALTDDPVFGRLNRGHLEDLWDSTRVAERLTEVCERTELTFVYGYGASLLAADGLHVYIDVPKDRGQELAGEQAIWNVGASAPAAFGTMYKRLYFVDWPMLNRIKRAELPRLHIFVDASNSEAPIIVEGDPFRRALHELAHQPFRVKPWFAPGPWGGQWMKDNFGLPPEQPNYAWSFELIAPENGVLLGNAASHFECSFDWMLWQETDAVLGPSVAARFGSYFPIRFDYLDTMGGTNLSCQVHPRVDYIREEFGEPFTQDETYYIVTCKPEARVFLGLRDDADLERFHSDAVAARDETVPFDIGAHVNSLPCAAHDLFLIPSGTVHCSGADNLVLEISATPYIYTFKIYDYLRSDLRGNLRHVHLDHAFANIDASRTTAFVDEHLCPRPIVLREGDGWAEYQIGNIEELFFAIHRLEFLDAMRDDTQGKFLALNLVEGECCDILTDAYGPVELRFAESVVIPANVGSYCLRNRGSRPCKVVKAFVKG